MLCGCSVKDREQPTTQPPETTSNVVRVTFPEGTAVSQAAQLLEENGVADYVIVCPKCKQYIGVRRHVGTQVIRRSFRTIGGTPFEYVYVFNHRITRTYQDGEIPMGTRIFYGEINNEIGEAQEEHPTVQSIWLPNQQYSKVNSAQ